MNRPRTRYTENPPDNNRCSVFFIIHFNWWLFGLRPSISAWLFTQGFWKTVLFHHIGLPAFAWRRDFMTGLKNIFKRFLTIFAFSFTVSRFLLMTVLIGSSTDVFSSFGIFSWNVLSLSWFEIFANFSRMLNVTRGVDGVPKQSRYRRVDL